MTTTVINLNLERIKRQPNTLGFEEWCEKFGFDPDSLKVWQAYTKAQLNPKRRYFS